MGDGNEDNRTFLQTILGGAAAAAGGGGGGGALESLGSPAGRADLVASAAEVASAQGGIERGARARGR